MKIFKLGLIVGLIAISLQAGVFNQTIKQRGNEIKISTPQSLTTGNNKFLIDLNKIKGSAIDNAIVKVKLFMPAMPGMPAMKFEREATKIGKGKYKVDLNIAMSGTWQVHIFIKPENGKKQRIKTSFSF